MELLCSDGVAFALKFNFKKLNEMIVQDGQRVHTPLRGEFNK